jgi:tetratricopeptide (TPR) repeat protein
VKPGNDLRTALCQYLLDYRRNKDDLLRDDGFALASPYKKTVWTAWETSLASLRKHENGQANIYPIHLLRFLSLLDRSNVQDELFRLASPELENACSYFGVEVPAWMQGLITNREDREWNSFSYRTTINLLLRYGLVRKIAQPWKGITMHSLVRWRASVEMDRDQYWHLYLAFIAVVCERLGTELKDTSFRRHVVVHLPPNEVILSGCDRVSSEGVWWTWRMLANMLWYEGRWKNAEELLLQLVDAASKVLGQEDLGTLTSICDLATTYRHQKRLQEAEELLTQVVEAMSRVHGKEDFHTLSAINALASTYVDQGRFQEAEELSLQVLETSSRVLGEEHIHTLNTITNLARTYSRQGRVQEAEKILIETRGTMTRVLGEEHPDTVTAKSMLAAIYGRQGRLMDAEKLFAEVREVRSRVLGEEHPHTLSSVAGLAHFRKLMRSRLS